jgi:hypothetical protein
MEQVLPSPPHIIASEITPTGDSRQKTRAHKINTRGRLSNSLQAWKYHKETNPNRLTMTSGKNYSGLPSQVTDFMSTSS